MAAEGGGGRATGEAQAQRAPEVGGQQKVRERAGCNATQARDRGASRRGLACCTGGLLPCKPKRTASKQKQMTVATCLTMEEVGLARAVGPHCRQGVQMQRIWRSRETSAAAAISCLVPSPELSTCPTDAQGAHATGAHSRHCAAGRQARVHQQHVGNTSWLAVCACATSVTAHQSH